MKKTWTRWVPAAVVPVVIAGVAVAIPVAADASPTLPTKTAQQVLELIGDSSVSAFSGTVEQSSDLGLPELPASVSGSADSALELLSGTHELRVFVDGADRQRVQVMDQLAERDVVRNGDDVWLYDSDAAEATHTSIPDHGSAHGRTGTDASALTPAEVATELLAKIDPTTEVTVGDTTLVAGRAAYTLTLTPRSTTTLVEAATLSVDSETGLPLAVGITSRTQAEPAFAVGFTTIDFTTPAASLFSFTPPAGTTVTEKAAPERTDTENTDTENTDTEKTDTEKTDTEKPDTELGAAPGADTTRAEPTVIGEGWDAIVELPASDAAASASFGWGSDGEDEPSAILDQLTTPVSGGRVLQTALASIFIAEDGRIFVGAVDADALVAAAAAR